MPNRFYWRHSRDSLLTLTAVQLFQIIAKHNGEKFDAAKRAIDEEYATLRGAQSERHGGKVQTAVNVYRDAGWIDLSPDDDGDATIKLTPSGKQALLLLGKLPDFLKTVPYFITELLGRYQLRNPARPPSRDQEYDEQLKGSDIFPYWTLFRIMRSCDNFVTSDELRRFVFQLRRTEDIPATIKQIHAYRKDKELGLSKAQLDRKYAPELRGAVYETKYLMTRLGTQVGKYPPVVSKEGGNTWRLEPAYIPFIDEILAKEPIFKEHLTEESWMKDYGRAVTFVEEQVDADDNEEPDDELDKLPDDDPTWLKVKDLLDAGSLAIVLSGPPGTSKTWYAWRLALKIVGDKTRNVRRIQFHPSYSYDDFIEGYIPVAPSSGLSSTALFQVVPKLFLRLCADAVGRPEEKFVLVIDEMTRGDISRIFGELLTYVEPEYRGKTFFLTYSGKRISIPKILLILGTMNPFDRSITELDDALERRFNRVPLNPDVKILRTLLQQAGAQGDLIERIFQFFNEANKLVPHGFGQTYFLGINSEATLTKLWNHKLKFVFEKIFRFDEDKFQEIRRLYAAQFSGSSELL